MHPERDHRLRPRTAARVLFLSVEATAGLHLLGITTHWISDDIEKNMPKTQHAPLERCIFLELKNNGNKYGPKAMAMNVADMVCGSIGKQRDLRPKQLRNDAGKNGM